MSGIISFVSNGFSLSSQQSTKGKVLGAGVGAVGGGVAVNLGKDLFPSLNNDFTFYGGVLVGAIFGWTFLGGWIGLADQLTTM